jgi:hypothetical protein
MSALDDSDQVLLRAMFEAHGTGGQVQASPFLSATGSEGLSSTLAAEGSPKSFLRQRTYVVRMQIPASEAASLNEVLGRAQSSQRAVQQLATEVEVLITADANGRVLDARPNPTSQLGRGATGLRVLGVVGNIASLGYSGYRISSARPEERPRVVSEEVGSQVGGWGGAAAGATICISFGIATGGIGLVACGIVGGVAGGAVGSAGGGALADVVTTGSLEPIVGEPPTLYKALPHPVIWPIGKMLEGSISDEDRRRVNNLYSSDPRVSFATLRAMFGVY